MNHTATARSWVEQANGHSDFPLQNLPLGIFSRPGEAQRCGVAIGDSILDLQAVLGAGLFEGEAKTAVEATVDATLNAYFALSLHHHPTKNQDHLIVWNYKVKISFKNRY